MPSLSSFVSKKTSTGKTTGPKPPSARQVAKAAKEAKFEREKSERKRNLANSKASGVAEVARRKQERQAKADADKKHLSLGEMDWELR